jgi:hypothetical protein
VIIYSISSVDAATVVNPHANHLPALLLFPSFFFSKNRDARPSWGPCRQGLRISFRFHSDKGRSAEDSGVPPQLCLGESQGGVGLPKSPPPGLLECGLKQHIPEVRQASADYDQLGQVSPGHILNPLFELGQWQGDPFPGEEKKSGQGAVDEEEQSQEDGPLGVFHILFDE